MRCYVLMGVSGCGKSSVGRAVAATCDITFFDGDDLHPTSNVEKMASGIPLTDADRVPWLEKVGDALAQTPGPVVLGCSALKRAYRDIIRDHASEPVHFLHLDAPQTVLQARVDQRAGHFMPPSLLQSQFDALEALETGELGIRIDIAHPFEAVVGQAVDYIRKTLQRHPQGEKVRDG